MCCFYTFNKLIHRSEEASGANKHVLVAVDEKVCFPAFAANPVACKICPVFDSSIFKAAPCAKVTPFSKAAPLAKATLFAEATTLAEAATIVKGAKLVENAAHFK